MILDATNICTDVELLNILTIFKALIKLVTIAVPVILIIFVIIDIIKTISSGDVDTKKLFKSVSKRVIAAVVVFLIPFIIELVIGIVPSGKFYYRDCYDSASKETVQKIAISNAEASLKLLETALDKFEETNKNNKDYKKDALKYYEQARQDIKLIYNGYTKEKLESQLKTYKDRMVKDGIK